MAFNLKQNPVMMMGKHTSCQFPAATHFRICRLPIRFQETIFSKPLYFTQPNFLIGLTGLSPGSGTRTWRAGGRSSWGRWSRTRRSFSSSSRGPTGRGASRRWTRFWTDSKLFQSGPEKEIIWQPPRWSSWFLTRWQWWSWPGCSSRGSRWLPALIFYIWWDISTSLNWHLFKSNLVDFDSTSNPVFCSKRICWTRWTETQCQLCWSRWENFMRNLLIQTDSSTSTSSHKRPWDK